MTEKKKVLLIDTYAFLYRSYYASEKQALKNEDGRDIGAYMGFFSTFLYLLKEISPSHIVFASDSHSPSKRKMLDENYKANRDKMPDSLKEQIKMVKNAFEVSSIQVIKEDGLEADDILVDFANRYSSEGYDVVIATGDKDILQCVSDKNHIFVYRPPSFGTKWTLYNETVIKEKYGFGKESIASYLSLLGDSSDNIKGVSGVGEKSAKGLLEKYKDLESIYNNIDEITPERLQKKLIEGKDDAFFSYSLVELGKYKYSKEFDIESAIISNINFSELLNVLKSDGLNSLHQRFLKFLNENGISYNRENASLKDDDSSEFHFESKEVTISELQNDIETSSIISVYFDNENSYFSYSLDGNISKYIRLNESYIKIISKLINAYLSSPFNTLISFDLKNVYKVINASLNEVKALSFDIEIASYLLDSETAYFKKELLSSKYLNLTIKPKAKKEKSLFEGDEPTFIESVLAFRLMPKLKEKLEEENLYSYYLKIEMPLTFVLAKMENNGIYLDKDEIDNLRHSLNERLEVLENEIYSYANEKFNISSPTQLSHILFDVLKIKSSKKNKTGFSVDKEVLESLEDAHPIVGKILSYRTLMKLKTTYTDALTSLISKNDNRLHTTFLQTGTATGRFASRNPNLQNIPIRNEEGRLVRKAFKSTDGNILLSLDYSQIELVVLAHFSKDRELVSMFKTGEDVHRLTASKVFKKNPSDVSVSERRAAKTINFGVIYGMSVFRLQKDLGVSHQEAAEFLNSYFTLFSGVKDFIENTIAKTRECGFTTTLLGHKRFFKTINDSNRNIRESAERSCVNSIIQGSAADILKKAMIDIERETTKSDKAKLLLNVHDELIFEVSNETKDSYAKKVENIMVHSVPLIVPLRVSVEMSTSWGDMH